MLYEAEGSIDGINSKKKFISWLDLHLVVTVKAPTAETKQAKLNLISFEKIRKKGCSLHWLQFSCDLLFLCENSPFLE